MPLSDEKVRALLLACRETHADEIDCEQYLMFVAEGRALPRALARVVEHERLCASCREESGALVELIRSGDDVR